VSHERLDAFGRRSGFEPIAVLGIVMTALLHGGAIGGILLYRRSLEAAQVPPPAPSYVVAKLLRLGKPKDEKKLPDKIVPQAATKKEESIDLSADADDAPARKKKRDEDRDAKIDSKLRRSLDKAELLAQAQRDIEGEGSPDGVRGGTATKAQGGDPYMTKIADLWNRTWTLPAIIPRAEASRLYVLIVLHIDKDGTIQTPLQFDRKSGNTHFDNSVVAGWAAIKKLPQPPPDRFASILANGLALKITWKGLQ
jgi:hypothetical protein